MTNEIAQQAETKFWIHPEGWIYVGDQIEGARAATETEIDAHMAKLKE
ncbi:hypothetical protein RSJ44_001933 [Yersinia enterocolitica]|nr:hypothetical protein [Yersinia enterocolitica]EKN3982781.1 hypothetical protein [Yersinia enterocolitica]EKN3983090.1 hypothetical protein [Yersinia enterocolitica]ELI8405273.1 hypothetical protein [Yersinia enterocolitica]UYJ99181.1 hypothetical protein N4W06_09075 [Yersinia enterocolitica]